MPMTYFPSVSVVVPAFNEEACIRHCVQSLLRQEYPLERFEIIVVDNGSSDDTVAILSAYRSQIRILHETRRGPGAARNSGIFAANNEIIAFTDSDCVAEQHWLANLVKPLSDPQVGVVGGRIRAHEPVTEMERYRESLTDHESSIMGKIPTVATVNWASRTADIRALGGFDCELTQGEDSDLSMRMFFAGHAFRYQPDAVVFHRNEKTLAQLFRVGAKHGMASVRLARKHAASYREMGIRRVYPQTYSQLLKGCFAVLTGDKRQRALCDVCFQTGKKAGKILGSFRYGRLEL